MSKKRVIKPGVKSTLKDGGQVRHKFQLFITGFLPNSTRAVENIKAICEKYLTGRYDLEIIDIYQQPSLAFSMDIVAIPMLVKQLPLPEEVMIGDLSDIESVLKGFRLI